MIKYISRFPTVWLAKIAAGVSSSRGQPNTFEFLSVPNRNTSFKWQKKLNKRHSALKFVLFGSHAQLFFYPSFILKNSKSISGKLSWDIHLNCVQNSHLVLMEAILLKVHCRLSFCVRDALLVQ